MKKNTSQIEFSKVHPVPTSLIQQNVYVRDVVNKNLVQRSVPKTYTSWDEIVRENGVEIVETVQDYPITPESVESYMASSDYRNDLENVRRHGAINLGDITDMQAALKMDSAEIDAKLALLEEAKRRIAISERPEASKTDGKEDMNNNE